MCSSQNLLERGIALMEEVDMVCDTAGMPAVDISLTVERAHCKIILAREKIELSRHCSVAPSLLRGHRAVRRKEQQCCQEQQHCQEQLRQEE